MPMPFFNMTPIFLHGLSLDLEWHRNREIWPEHGGHEDVGIVRSKPGRGGRRVTQGQEASDGAPRPGERDQSLKGAAGSHGG